MKKPFAVAAFFAVTSILTFSSQEIVFGKSETSATRGLSATATVAGSHAEMAVFLDRQMKALVQNRQMPNAAVALVTADDIQLLHGYGFADLAAGTEVDPQKHLFRTGSVAKIFTWTAIMQLFEEGMLDLDDAISPYLDSDIHFPVKYKTDAADPITFRHLLTHTAGFEDVLDGLFTFSPQPPLSEYVRKRAPARIYPPGKVMAYSNYGTALAGYIVERVSGLRFEDYVETRIFSPLGMQNCSFRQFPVAFEEQLVNPYRWVEGAFVQGEFEYMPGPAGGLSCSAEDMALFLQANLNPGTNTQGIFLQQETLARMHSSLFTYHPLLGGMAHGFKEFMANGQHIIFHGGSSSVFDAGFYLLPDAGLGIFIVYSGGNYSGHITILHAFLDHFFPVDEEAASMQLVALSDTLSPIPDAPEIGDLAGEYFQSRAIESGSDKILNLIMGSVFLTVNENDQFQASLLGEELVFEELVPGIYRNTAKTVSYPFGPLQYLVVDRAPDGRMMLVTDGPLTYIKAPWYGGTVMAMAVILPAMVLAVLSLLALLVVRIIDKFRKRPVHSKNSKKAGNGFLAAHAVLLLFMILLLILYGRPHPVHLLPETAFTDPSWIDSLMNFMPAAISLLGIFVASVAFVSWEKKNRSLSSRIWYSMYSIWSLGLIWFFYYYNMLGF